VCDSSDGTVQGITHAYGEYAFGSLSEGNDCEDYTTVEDVRNSRKLPKYYCRRAPPGQQEFAYRFLEYNPGDLHRTYPYLTDRVNTASAGPCETYSLSHVDAGTDEGGKWSNYTYSSKDSIRGSVLLPVQVDTFDGTVYIYRGLKTPQTADTWACGDRCISMWAHKTESVTEGGKEPSTFYQCNFTVDAVQVPPQEKLQDAHRVPNDIPRLAASSVGLQGGNSDPDNGWTSFQFYPVSQPSHAFKFSH